MNIGVIITMASVTIGSAITQKILEASGKTAAAQYLEVTTITGLATTVVYYFIKFAKELGRLG